MSIHYPDNTASRAALPASGIATDTQLVFDAVYGGLEKSISLDELKKTGVQVINVKQYGAIGDGIADDTAAIQAAIDAATTSTNRPIVYLPPGKYITSSTLIINDDYVTIIGGSSPSLYRGDDSVSITRGATIRYTGTGTAVLVGIAPGTNGTYILGTHLENLRIEVDDDTAIGLRVWHSNHGRFQNIIIFGMTGNTNIGLLVQAGIDNIYEHLEIAGIGQSLENTYSDMAIGFKGDLGYNNEQATTTIFRRCYFHYCSKGAYLNYRYDFEDCIFEACDRGVEAIAIFDSSFLRCWWEANVTYDIYFNSSSARLTDCKINSYSRETYFAPGNGIKHLTVRGCEFSTTDSSPILFYTGNNVTSASGSIIMSGNILPSGLTLGGASYVRAAYDTVSNIDMNREIYRFIGLATGASATLNPMNTEGGVTSYRMPSNGHVVGLHIYGSLPLASGVWDIAVKKNGSSIADFSYPTIGFQSLGEINFKKEHYKNYIAEGDDLTVYFHTGTGISPSMDYVVEVIVALGNDGISIS